MCESLRSPVCIMHVASARVISMFVCRLHHDTMTQHRRPEKKHTENSNVNLLIVLVGSTKQSQPGVLKMT